jgi:response regulator RpfG family c-di-GMP phosphodiesterase
VPEFPTPFDCSGRLRLPAPLNPLQRGAERASQGSYALVHVDPPAVGQSALVQQWADTQYLVMGRTILLLDGHDGVRSALAARLRHAEGVRAVDAVSELSDALSLASSKPPDAVIYDPHTVEGRADDVIPQLAAGGRPVIVLTSSLVGDEAAALTRAGAAALLLKGSNVSSLLREIEDTIDERRRAHHS